MRGHGRTHPESPGRTSLIGERQEYEKDDLGVADAALESLRLARLELELRLLEQALGVAEILRDPAAEIVDLTIPTGTWAVPGT